MITRSMTRSTHPLSTSSNSSTKSGNTKQISPAKNWFFTFNNYSQQDYGMMKEKCSDSSIILRSIFQEEVGASGTPHLQGAITFLKKVRPKSIFKSDKIHWEKTRSTRLAEMYCCDESKRVEGGRIENFNVHIPRPLVKMTYDKLRPWQKEIADLFKEPEDPLFGRTIHWFWESTGNIGKTILCTYLVDQCNAIEVGGASKDALYGVASYVTKMKCGPDIVIIDIPRCQENISWHAIEKIKDGKFYSPKYESMMVRYNRPHIICMANCPPPTEKLSDDRWHIQELSDNDPKVIETDDEVFFI